MKLSVLIENTASSPEFACEHGLSLFIETKQHKILFDTGQSDNFFKNAQKMHINIAQADLAVLSHGHYDHGGGLSCFFQVNKTAPVYIHKDARGEFYNANGKYIGLDRELLHNPRIIFTENTIEICHGIQLAVSTAKETTHSLPKQNLHLRTNSVMQKDTFTHEQYLILEENGKKILITGCSHKGILNILQWFNPDCIIGGFHFSQYGLHGREKEELQNIAEQMAAYPAQFYTGHCTGTEQFRFLKNILKDRIMSLSSGQQIII